MNVTFFAKSSRRQASFQLSSLTDAFQAASIASVEAQLNMRSTIFRQGGLMERPVVVRRDRGHITYMNPNGLPSGVLPPPPGGWVPPKRVIKKNKTRTKKPNKAKKASRRHLPAKHLSPHLTIEAPREEQ